MPLVNTIYVCEVEVCAVETVWDEFGKAGLMMERLAKDEKSEPTDTLDERAKQLLEREELVADAVGWLRVELARNGFSGEVTWSIPDENELVFAIEIEQSLKLFGTGETLCRTFEFRFAEDSLNDPKWLPAKLSKLLYQVGKGEWSSTMMSIGEHERAV